MRMIDKIFTTSICRQQNYEFTTAEMCSSFGPDFTKEAVSDALSKAVEKGLLLRRRVKRGNSRINYYRSGTVSRLLSKVWVENPTGSACTPVWF